MANLSFLTTSRINPDISDVAVVTQLQWLIDECEDRMLTDTVKWASEVLVFLPEQWLKDFENQNVSSLSRAHYVVSLASRKIIMAKSLILTKEFARASFFLSEVKSDNCINKFLYYWSRYLLCTKIRLENESEAVDHRITNTGYENKEDYDMAELLQDMYNDCRSEPKNFDAFLYYLMGKIEHALGDNTKAFEHMKEAIKMEPRLWTAWEEIVELLPTAEDIQPVYLLEMAGPNAWMSDWFLSLALRRFNYDRNATEKIDQFIGRGFPEIPIILSHKAAMADKMLEHTRAIELFSKLRAKDPLRIEEMHLYCDSLFCMSERTTLTSLTHSFYKTHKYNWETAYIVGNYYTIRGEHEQAVRFFQRALRLNPKQASIWVVIGHEFVELKNNSAACLAYRRAIEIDPQEYRAWYGLGQLYDILKMSYYALYYYQEAHKCRPVDSRILVALGLIYTKTNKTRDAIKCFTVAHKNGDVEGTALWHLGRLFEKEEMTDNAARTYEEFLKTLDQIEVDHENLPYVLRFLAKYFANKDEWDKAKTYAQRCLAHESIAEEGRRILRDIAAKEEQIGFNMPSADASTDMQISDGEGDVSYD